MKVAELIVFSVVTGGDCDGDAGGGDLYPSGGRAADRQARPLSGDIRDVGCLHQTAAAHQLCGRK